MRAAYGFTHRATAIPTTPNSSRISVPVTTRWTVTTGSRPSTGTRSDVTAPAIRKIAGAGIRIHRRPGEPVTAGEPLFTLYTDTPERFGAALAELDGGWSIDGGAAGIQSRPLIIDRIVR